MIIIALIIITMVMLSAPGLAQDGNYPPGAGGNADTRVWARYIAQAAPIYDTQPFQGLNYPPAYAAPAAAAPPYPSSPYPPANMQPYMGQNNPPGNAQFYQNPNYPLQGAMRINRNAPYGTLNNMQPVQNNYYSTPNNQYSNSPNQYNAGQNQNYPTQIPNYPGAGNMPPQNQNYPTQMPSYSGAGNMSPNLSTGYPMPGGLQPFTPTLLPSPNNIPEASRRQAGELVNKAYELSNSGNNEQAIVLLKQSESLDPSSPSVHLDLSAAYMALKDYDDALHETTILLTMDPNSEQGYVNYLAAAIGANRMQDALRVGQEYLNRFPNGQSHAAMANEMVAVEHELDHRAHARGIMAPPGAPDNYLFYATPNGIRRWAPGSMPLRVYINHGKKCKGFEPAFETVLINSFLIWQNATRGMMRFVPVDNARQANIECKWTDSAANVSLAAEAGEAKLEISGNSIYHVNITLLTCRPESPSEKLTTALLQQVSLHEIGHALGIDGHSDRAQDVMYCSTNPNVEHPQLTQRDVNTLYLIYR